MECRWLVVKSETKMENGIKKKDKTSHVDDLMMEHYGSQLASADNDGCKRGSINQYDDCSAVMNMCTVQIFTCVFVSSIESYIHFCYYEQYGQLNPPHCRLV